MSNSCQTPEPPLNTQWGAIKCQDTQQLLWPNSCRPAGLRRHPLHCVQLLPDSYVTPYTVSSSCRTPMSPPAGLLCHPPHYVQLLPNSQHHPRHRVQLLPAATSTTTPAHTAASDGDWGTYIQSSTRSLPPTPYCRQSSFPPTPCCRPSPCPGLSLPGPRPKMPRPGATNRTPRGPTPAPPSTTLTPATPAPTGHWSYRPCPYPPTLCCILPAQHRRQLLRCTVSSSYRLLRHPLHRIQLLPDYCASLALVPPSCPG